MSAVLKPSRDLMDEILDCGYWYHRIELPGGIVTPGWAPIEPALYQVPESLAGLRVLDVGAWDGYWSFEALRRGARQMVAVDDFSDQVSDQEWNNARPGPFVPWRTFDLCAEALGYSGSDRLIRYERSVYDLDATDGEFDVVLCFGVLYHCRHPLLAIDKLAERCPRGSIYVESAVCDRYSPYNITGYPGNQMVMEFYPGQEYAGNPTNWWAPTTLCLAQMVKAAGWPVTSAQAMTPSPDIPKERRMWYYRGFVQGHREDGKNANPEA